MGKIQDFFASLESDRARFRFLCLFGACVGLFIGFKLFVNTVFFQGVSNYQLAHHFLCYDLGFVPRALYGATLGNLTRILPKWLYFFFWLLPIFFPCVLFFRHYVKYRNCNPAVSEYLDGIFLFALTLPTTWLPLNDFLRLDTLLLGLFWIAGFWCWQRSVWRFATPLLIVLMVLIHEAAIFMFFPALLGIVVFRCRTGNRRDRLLVLVVFISILISCLLYALARSTPVVPAAMDRLLQSRCPYAINGKLSMAGHFASIESGYFAYMLHTMSWYWLGGMLFSIPFIGLAIWVFVCFWRSIWRSVADGSAHFKKKLLFLILCSGSNLGLFIGCDFNRWIWALFSVHLFFLLMILTDGDTILALPRVAQGRKRVLVAICVLWLVIGPGDGWFFSELSKLAGACFGWGMGWCHLLPAFGY